MKNNRRKKVSNIAHFYSLKTTVYYIRVYIKPLIILILSVNTFLRRIKVNSDGIK